MQVLGISANFHDAAAALVRDGEIVAAAEEERFTRVKHDPSLPVHAIAWCLEQGGVGRRDLDAVAFYEKPLSTFGRILRTHARVGPKGVASFTRALPEWTRRKLWIGHRIERALADLGVEVPGSVHFAEHHESHAASAFYPSPFEEAAVLTFDGVGEWATTSIGEGSGRDLRLLQEVRFPHSIGLLYSAFTHVCGFEVNEGEYKLMGLAPYGEPTYVERILDHLVHLADDGSFVLDQRFFSYLGGRAMVNRRFERAFDGPPRRPDAPITRRELDLARSVQVVTEELVLRIAAHAHRLTGHRRAVLAGGVALNCVANGRLLREGPFDELWAQPAAGDAGGALGCALLTYHRSLDGARPAPPAPDGMRGALLGPTIDDAEVQEVLLDADPDHAISRLGPAALAEEVARLLAAGRVVAVCAGPMEFGPRSLGNRSILADPRDPDAQTTLNLKVKFRESFRPFAPAVLAERASSWFDLVGESPYMLFTAPVAGSQLVPVEPLDTDDVLARVRQVRSTIPAVTHVDGSARVQTVTADRAPGLRAILEAFEARTGCPVLVNTSFNVRGEPIVRSAADAYRCFRASGIDALVLGDHLVVKPAPGEPPSEQGVDRVRHGGVADHE